MHFDVHSSQKKPLNLTDVLAASALFICITYFLDWVMANAVPGLLKPETLAEIRWSGGLFIFFWAIAGNFILKPYIDSAVERESKTTGALASAAEKNRECREILQQIEVELKELRVSASKQRDAVVEEAKKEVAKLIDAAQAMAAEHRKKGQAHIAMLKEEASANIAAESEKLAHLVLKRALSPMTSVSARAGDV